MRLAVGDGVRDRSDMAIGTVASLDSYNTRLVVVSVPGGTLRVTSGRDLELVRLCSPPMTSMHRLVAMLIVVAGVFVAYVAAHSVSMLGGSWLLMYMAALGAYMTFEIGYRVAVRSTGPQRFRV
jgi:hypothetical protein